MRSNDFAALSFTPALSRWERVNLATRKNIQRLFVVAAPIELGKSVFICGQL
jgi:hypothetical protein